jgi:hypothetical protein
MGKRELFWGYTQTGVSRRTDIAAWTQGYVICHVCKQSSPYLFEMQYPYRLMLNAVAQNIYDWEETFVDACDSQKVRCSRRLGVPHILR